MQELSIVKSSLSKQIAEQLPEAIVNGRFKIGDRLPTEDELAQCYGVSRLRCMNNCWTNCFKKGLGN